jgi:hypothetical protein
MSAVPPVAKPPTAPATISDIETALENFAASAKTEESKLWTWVKTNVPHFVTWALSIISALKIFGKL